MKYSCKGRRNFIGKLFRHTPTNNPFRHTAIMILYSILVHPQFAAGQKYLYATNQFDNSISQYTLNANGSLTPLNPATVTTSLIPDAIVVDPKGSYVYVLNAYNQTISQFGIDSKGALYALNPSTVLLYNGFATGHGWTNYGWEKIIVDPTGHYAYAMSLVAGGVSQYSINSDGTLRPLTPAFATANWFGPVGITSDYSGQYVYVSAAGTANEPQDQSQIAQFQIGPSGTLIPLMPALAPPNTAEGFSLTADPVQPYVYSYDIYRPILGLAPPPSAINVLSSGGSANPGALHQVGSTPITNTSWYLPMAIEQTGRFLYFSNDYAQAPSTIGASVSKYAIAADGTLSLLDTVIEDLNPIQSIVIDPTNQFLYVATLNFTTANMATQGNISAFAINSNTGDLTPVPGSPFLTGVYPSAMAIATVPTNNTPWCIAHPAECPLVPARVFTDFCSTHPGLCSCQPLCSINYNPVILGPLQQGDPDLIFTGIVSTVDRDNGFLEVTVDQILSRWIPTSLKTPTQRLKLSRTKDLEKLTKGDTYLVFARGGLTEQAPKPEMMAIMAIDHGSDLKGNMELMRLFLETNKRKKRE